MRRLALALLLGGCSVVDEPYPAAWEPLGSPPPDCRRFAGTYADRGEAPGQTARPSLTRELFGPEIPWEEATRVRLELIPEGAVVTVEGMKQPFTRQFLAKAGEYRCSEGKLVLRNRRWVTSDLMSGRESVKIELHEASPSLVVHVREWMTGVMFVVVPLSGESARWFRFPRMDG